jgi:hypothetical protein
LNKGTIAQILRELHKEPQCLSLRNDFGPTLECPLRLKSDSSQARMTTVSIQPPLSSENSWGLPDWLMTPVASLMANSVAQPLADTDILKLFSIVPGLKELLMLRQIHALEHATVWILSQTTHNPALTDYHLDDVEYEVESFSGISTEQGFYLSGNVPIERLRQVVEQALHRLTCGEAQLAIHPHCGTNLSVELLLMSGLMLGAHLLLPREPLEQLVGLGLAAAAATYIAPGVGTLLQQYLMTATPFNLVIVNIINRPDPDGQPAQFVSVRWVD